MSEKTPLEKPKIILTPDIEKDDDEFPFLLLLAIINNVDQNKCEKIWPAIMVKGIDPENGRQKPI